MAFANDDLLFESAANVNEGQLHFLDQPPGKPVHHHQNRIRIEADSLVTGWVSLVQCHDNLDPVPRAQITFREGFVRDLRVESSHGVTETWIEGASVQLRQIGPGSRVCLAAQTRALRNTGNGYFNLVNGPYMRKFLDGYYPMRVTLDIDYPPDLLSFVDASPLPVPGQAFSEQPGRLHMDALFEGELRTLVQFTRP
ncbi:MAG: hypothetical protein AB1593_05525 [Pseudomonadota bacterium]